MIDINFSKPQKCRNVQVVISVLLILGICLGCTEEEAPDLTYRAPNINLSFKPDLGIYYKYNLDSMQATINTFRTPSGGFYNTYEDFEIIKKQIALCKEIGIEFWILNTNENSGVQNGYIGNVAYRSDSVITTFKDNVPEFQNIQYLIRYSQNHNILEDTGLESLEAGLKKVIDDHFSDQNYYSIEGKPVIMLVDEFLDEEMRPSDDPQADPRVPRLESLRASIESYAGKEVFFILDVIEFNPPQRMYDISQWADAVTGTRLYSGQNSISLGRYNLAYEKTFKNWKDVLKRDSINTPVIPSATLGRNDTTTYYLKDGDELVPFKNNTWVLGGTKQHFKEQLQIAKSIVTPQMPIVLVESWNDWYRGDAIEPSEEDGRIFVDVLKQEF